MPQKKARAPAPTKKKRLEPLSIPHSPEEALKALMEADPRKVEERLQKSGVKKKKPP